MIRITECRLLRITEGEEALDCPHEGAEHLLGQEEGAQSQTLRMPTKEGEETIRKKKEEEGEEGRKGKVKEEEGTYGQ